MGLFDWLWNLFSPKPRVVEPLVISPPALDAEIERHFAGDARALSDLFVKKGASIKFLLKDIRQKALALDTTPADASDRVEKMVSTSTKASVRTLANLFDKLAPPSSDDILEWRAYAYSSLSTLQNASGFLGKNIAIASFGQKEKFQALGSRIEELSDELESIRLECAKHAWIDARAEIRDAVRDLKDPLPLESQKRELETILAELENRLVASRDQLLRTEAKPEFGAIKKLQTRLEELKEEETNLKTKLSNLFSPLEKPWRKWVNQPELANRLSAENRDTIASLLKNPLDCLLRESKSGPIERALSEWKAMADADTNSDFRKLTEHLDGVLALDFWNEYFWPLNRCHVERQKTEKMLADSPLSADHAKQSRAVSDLERQWNQHLIERSHLEKRLEKVLEERAEQLSRLREKTAALLDRPVEFAD